MNINLDWTSVILALLTLAGVVGGPYLALRQKKVEQKAQQEIARTTGQSTLITQMAAQIEEFDKDLREARSDTRELHRSFLSLQAAVAEWEIGVRILSRQVIRLGEDPDWVPPATPIVSTAYFDDPH